MNGVWERVMLALVVCVPVPALALSGLNVPLPSVVERIAAGLVPFANVARLDDDATLVASGRIVRTSARGTASISDARTGAEVAVRVRRAPTTTTARRQPSETHVDAPTAAVSALAPATAHGEDTATPSAAEPSATEPSTPTSNSSSPASTPSEPSEPSRDATQDTKPKPGDRLDAATTADVDVSPEPTFEVTPAPNPDVKPEPEPKVDADPAPSPDVKPSDPPATEAPRNADNRRREPGQ